MTDYVWVRSPQDDFAVALVWQDEHDKFVYAFTLDNDTYSEVELREAGYYVLGKVELPRRITIGELHTVLEDVALCNDFHKLPQPLRQRIFETLARCQVRL